MKAWLFCRVRVPTGGESGAPVGVWRARQRASSAIWHAVGSVASGVEDAAAVFGHVRVRRRQERQPLQQRRRARARHQHLRGAWLVSIRFMCAQGRASVALHSSSLFSTRSGCSSGAGRMPISAT